MFTYVLATTRVDEARRLFGNCEKRAAVVVRETTRVLFAAPETETKTEMLHFSC